MATNPKNTIVVTGATGRQGGAVAHSLLQNRWNVRALTRNLNSPKAQTLAALGAEVVQGDMEDRSTLQTAFEGAYGVYSVQNPMISGLEAEIRQGKQVGEIAREADIQHFVYASAGIGKPTGIGSWDSKLEIEVHLKSLNLPLTVMRPMAFMELMTDKAYYPAVSTWHIMPKLMGSSRPVGWLNTGDLGVIVAKIFADPESFIGQEIKLVSDVKSIEECRIIYRDVIGKAPPRFPMPVWLFKRLVGDDLINMWQWLRTAKIELDTEQTYAIHPGAQTVDSWLRVSGFKTN